MNKKGAKRRSQNQKGSNPKLAKKAKSQKVEKVNHQKKHSCLQAEKGTNRKGEKVEKGNRRRNLVKSRTVVNRVKVVRVGERSPKVKVLLKVRNKLGVEAKARGDSKEGRA
ncbi:MAG: hypothetical protein OWS74_05295, partial [Firmicutes bacterium]|nr:hypothetical protein [Bacillota bacterium]